MPLPFRAPPLLRTNKNSPPASIRALAFHCRLPSPHPPRTPPRLGPAHSLMPFSSQPTGQEEDEALLSAAGGAGEVSHEEWQRWGTTSLLPAAVAAVVRELLEMEAAAGEKMRFGGVGSKLKGDFKDIEDKKHRAVYETLADSDKKLQYFSARQIGCRLLGSRGYLCQKCWLPTEDCLCARLLPCNLWRGMKFWLYMHPKDFLRQNNTRKLLWQVFGIQAAQLCLFGIQEHEDIMWDAFQCSGKGKISCLYPNKSSVPKSVNDLEFDGLVYQDTQGWTYLFCRLVDLTYQLDNYIYGRWTAVWGEEDIPCISLSALTASVMHKLRPQPAWDRTCTAAGLLWELHMRPDLRVELEKQAEAVEDSLDILLDALTARRVRLGRSITRKQRHNRNCV